MTAAARVSLDGIAFDGTSDDRPADVLVLPFADPGRIGEVRAWAGSGRLLAVDGGWDRCVEAGVAPDLWVGDGDSVAAPPDGVPQRRLPRDKDHGDLRAALNLTDARRVVALGVTGGRADHEWINLLELAEAARDRDGVLALGARATVCLTPRGVRVALGAGRTFSLLAMGGAPRVRLSGARWNLDEVVLRHPSHGLSNLAEGPLRMRCEGGVVALVVPEGIDP